MTNLYEEQLNWAKLVRSAAKSKEVEPQELTLNELQKCKPLDTINPAFGTCTACHKHRRLWAGICGWCGADPDESEE